LGLIFDALLDLMRVSGDLVEKMSHINRAIGFFSFLGFLEKSAPIYRRGRGKDVVSSLISPPAQYFLACLG
jgi:hypothetical protein